MRYFAVISDSHESKRNVEQFKNVALERRFDAVVFCGDGLRDAKALKKELPMPVTYVAGNCDWTSKASREEVLSFGGVRMLLCHGDKYNVKWDKTMLSYRAEEVEARVALFGHTHVPFCEYVGKVLLVNPGALMRGCYAEVMVEDSGRVDVRLMRL